MDACISVTHHTVKCDLAAYATIVRMCDTTHMQQNSEMARIHEALRRAMARKGIAAKPLSLAAGLGETAVRDLFDGKDVKIGTLQKLAVALECSLEDLIGAEAVPLSGRIGAGGSIIFEDMGDDQFVVRPPGMSGPLEALEVMGDSMLPRYSSGDVVYIRRTHDGILKEYIGEFCAVRLVTGETYLKQLSRGAQPGTFTLRSLNAADMEDVHVQWATPILFVLPKFSRQHIFAI